MQSVSITTKVVSLNPDHGTLVHYWFYFSHKQLELSFFAHVFDCLNVACLCYIFCTLQGNISQLFIKSRTLDSLIYSYIYKRFQQTFIIYFGCVFDVLVSSHLSFYLHYVQVELILLLIFSVYKHCHLVPFVIKQLNLVNSPYS